jgi:Ala-tRNA(Pro) deacylase
LAALGIETETVTHSPAFTVAESSAIDIPLPGAHTKNLFLKDEKGTLVLVVAKSTTAIDLKGLAKRLGMGRFSFGKPSCSGMCSALRQDPLRPLPLRMISSCG